MSTQGRHRSRRRFRGRVFKVLVWTVLALVLLGSGTAFAAYRYERGQTGLILPGISVGGVAVGEMTRAEAIRAVSERIDARLDRTLKVTVRGKVLERSPRDLGATADVEGAVDRAFAVADSYSWLSRVVARVWERPVEHDVGVAFGYDRRTVAKWLEGLAKKHDAAPVDASVDWADGRLVLTESRAGRTLKQKVGADRVLAALRSGAAEVTLPFKKLAPQVTEEDLGKTIVIRTGINKLYLYEGARLVKEYEVATGTPGYPTPHGHFQIINKRVNPTWVNPAPDGWGADLPASIGPGPGNPLGTRALDLNAPGIRIHGTYASDSIGSWASHGCIRMHIAQSEELFELVDVGTPVIVVY